MLIQHSQRIIIHIIAHRFPKLNPSFRLYEVDKETFTVLDYVQYRLYVSDANKNDRPEWKKAYRFTEFYQVPNLDYYNFPQIVERMNKNETLFKAMMDLQWAEGPRGRELLESFPSIFLILIPIH